MTNQGHDAPLFSWRFPVLVLTRHKDEAIVIDPRTCPADELGRIVIRVMEIRGSQNGKPIKGKKVRIGIDAPKNMAVHRQEVQDIIDGAAK
jgi:sRNA-binding carbon storage regulator CsrA